MSFFDTLISNLPEVASPTQTKLGFKEKLKWTLITLVLFYVMGLIPLFGLGQNAIQQFEYLSIILASKFGSLISLGIGPIVTSSIVLQLLNGSGIFEFDLTSPEGKGRFQGVQKLLAVFFIVFEAGIYVFMGGLAPAAVGSTLTNGVVMSASLYFKLELMLVFQLILGGIMILFMDEVIQKWGFGSGISLFIAAGVSQSIFMRVFNPLASPTNPNISSGALWALIQSLGAGDPITAGIKLSAMIATCVVFVMAVYTQAMKIEIPLSFGRVRGHGIRWPLKFIYTSNIPVILVAALLANVQLWARLVQNWVGRPTFLGGFSGRSAISGLAAWIRSPNIVNSIIKGSVTFADFGHALVYMIIMIIGCIIFSIFWVQTSGLDAKSQAKQILSSGLQIPGFRKDIRILETVLNRYIGPLTVMGAIAIGLLAGIADLSGAIGSGTGILLTVMIIYNLYEEISKQHMMDMNPMMRKFMQ